MRKHEVKEYQKIVSDYTQKVIFLIILLSIVAVTIKLDYINIQVNSYTCVACLVYLLKYFLVKTTIDCGHCYEYQNINDTITASQLDTNCKS